MPVSRCVEEAGPLSVVWRRTLHVTPRLGRFIPRPKEREKEMTLTVAATVALTVTNFSCWRHAFVVCWRSLAVVRTSAPRCPRSPLLQPSGFSASQRPQTNFTSVARVLREGNIEIWHDWDCALPCAVGHRRQGNKRTPLSEVVVHHTKS